MSEKLDRASAGRINPVLAAFLINQGIAAAEGAALVLLENPAIAARYLPKLRRLRDSLNTILGDEPAAAPRKRVRR